MTKIFVVGGAGYIGSVTAECLIEQGYSVVIFDNLERGHREAVHPRAKLIEGDLRDKEQITKAMLQEMPECVVHLAAYINVGESMEKPIDYFYNGVTGSLNLASAMVEARTQAKVTGKSGDYQNVCRKLVFSSTCATYGTPPGFEEMMAPVAPGGGDYPIKYMDESLSQNPESVYGESKLLCEKMFQWIQKAHNIEFVFLRYFNACGASERYGEAHGPETHLIPLVLQVALQQRDKIEICGDDYQTRDGTCIRDYIHIKDLAQAHILGLKKGISGPFNLGIGQGFSVKEVIDVCRQVTGHTIPSEIKGRRAGDCPVLVANARKAKEELGWTPQYPKLINIIESAWKWHSKFPNGYKNQDIAAAKTGNGKEKIKKKRMNTNVVKGIDALTIT